ncbi:hypothetical protein AB0K18_43085 [Nonomuraea sp. NPDC049421]|uniref:hypothetical protein n=1 Tax=Nonomuraea sp. NPDC049421 TaxID=3155275 RepID=UPI003427D271
MAKTQAVEHSAPPLPMGGVMSQATTIEASRAVAEVAGAIRVAQEVPRNMQVATTMMREATSQMGLAERAFYKYPRGGQSVTGASIHLARELARCFGNVDYGIVELSRDEERGRSEVKAWAWDMQTNARTSNTFIAPHMRDVRGGAQKITDLRDVYENNANLGARRLREMIFAILPSWFVEEAKERCAATLAHGGGVPLAKRIADAIAGFNAIGVTVDRLEKKVGRPNAQWTDFDVANLGVTYKSIQRGEVTIAAEFPDQPVTADEVLQGAATPPPPAVEPPTTSPATGTAAGPAADAAGDDGWPEVAKPGSGRARNA